MNNFETIGTEIGQLVARKNRAYGSSFQTVGEAMRLLYPDGISPAQMDQALLLTRIWDKMMRVATDRDAFGESPFRDIAGYGILGAAMQEQRKEGQARACGSVSDAELQSEELSGGSVGTPASEPTTPNASASSEPVKEDAPVPTATEVVPAGLGAVRERMRARNGRDECGACSKDLKLMETTSILKEFLGESFWVCARCYAEIWGSLK